MKHDLTGPPPPPGVEDKRKGTIIGTCFVCGAKGVSSSAECFGARRARVLVQLTNGRGHCIREGAIVSCVPSFPGRDVFWNVTDIATGVFMCDVEHRALQFVQRLGT